MPSSALASTATLLRRFQSGDTAAQEELIERCLPTLRRWARGRLPGYARDLADTDDLVQTTVMRTITRLPSLAPRESGSFLAYLRTVLVNEIRDQLRRRERSGTVPGIAETSGAAAVASESTDPTVRLAYERALDELTTEQRDAIVLRLELGLSFPEIAIELGLPSADAARMRVSRALAVLAEVFAP